ALRPRGVHRAAPRCSAQEPLDGLARPALGPVRPVREVVVDCVDVDAGRIVVQLVAAWQRPLPAASARSRKPPCSSYDAVITASTSRAPRSVSPTAGASERGLRRRG